jgi:hypothetical protein
MRWKREKFKALMFMMPVWTLFAGIMAFKSYGPQIVTSAGFPPCLLAIHCSNKVGEGKRDSNNCGAMAYFGEESLW